MESASERLLRHRPPPPKPYPWLVYYHGKRFRNQTFCDISDPNNTYVRSIPELRENTVMASSHGWLILSHDEKENHYSLWNPVTLESIHLPPLKLNPNRLVQVDECALSSPPHNPDSTLVLLDNNLHSIIFCSLEDREWIMRGYSNDLKAINEGVVDEGDFLSYIVSCNNKLYATTFRRTRLVEIEILKPNCLVITSLQCKLEWSSTNHPRSSRLQMYLVECCGELYIINTWIAGIYSITSFDILKLDFSNMIWEEVESVEGRAFFLSNGSAISCPIIQSDRAKGSFIYFTLHQDKSLYAYNTEDKSISMSLPCPNLLTPWTRPIWLMTDIRFSSVHGNAKCIVDKVEQGENDETEVIKDKEQYETDAEEEEEARGHLLDFPFDILKLISRKLIVVDYMNFREVCRMCRSVAPPIQWRTVSRELQAHTLSPWLMFPHRENGVGSFVDPKLSGRYLITIPQVLEDATICCSKDGWLLMCKSQSCMFFNPLTKSIIQLPDLSLYFDFYSLSFSSFPTSNDFIVIGILGFFQGYVEFCVIASGETEWTNLKLSSNFPFCANHNNAVSIDGAFYFLGTKGNLGVFRVEEEECTWEVLSNPKAPCNSFHQNFLLECEGQLLSVFVGKSGKWVQVFKLNFSKIVWEEVKNLGNHMLFVCGSSSFSAVAEIPEMANKIYFPRFYGQNIVFYSLDSCKYHTFGSKDSLTNYYDTREQLLSAWIEPRWSS